MRSPRETAVWPEWELREIIGIGGWGQVYRAERRDHPEIQAAVKVMDVPARRVAQVLEEIRRMKQFEGTSSIVSIEDYAMGPAQDGRCRVYIRMELLTPLRRWLGGEEMAEASALRMGMAVCDALTLCHKNGILHGDIKPDNILVKKLAGSEPMFKLGDFGVARALESETEREAAKARIEPGQKEEGSSDAKEINGKSAEPTIEKPKSGEARSGTEQTTVIWKRSKGREQDKPKQAEIYTDPMEPERGTESFTETTESWIRGTPEYMAPEQLNGVQDERSDLYSLGITIYRFLNGGRLPFLNPYLRLAAHEERMAAVKSRLSGQELPQASGASEQTMAVLRKVCAFRPEERYPSAEVFKEALSAAARGSMKTGKPAEDRRKKLERRLLASAAAALVAGGAIWAAVDGRIGMWKQTEPASTQIPLHAVRIGAEDPLESGLQALSAVWEEQAKSGLPEELTMLPFVMEAGQYMPKIQWEEKDDEILIRMDGKKGGWGISLLSSEMKGIPAKYRQEEQCWACSAALEPATVCATRVTGSAGEQNAEYWIDLQSEKTQWIYLTIRENGDTAGLQIRGTADEASDRIISWRAIATTGGQEQQQEEYDAGGRRTGSETGSVLMKE